NHKVIVKWATAYRKRTGRWPTSKSGPIPESPGDRWLTVDGALKSGCRGLRPGSSLARLLHEWGKKRNYQSLPPLSHKRILAWADAQFSRTGKWPTGTNGAVTDAPGERWDLIDYALRAGSRGLTGGSSLIQLLARKRGVRNPLDLPPLSVE